MRPLFLLSGAEVSRPIFCLEFDMTEVKKPSVKKKPVRRGKQLSPSEKAEAIALWKAGTVTLDQLSDRFHRDRSTFVRLFNSEDVTKGENREALDRKAEEAVASTAVTDAITRSNRIRETKEDHYTFAKFLQKANQNILVKALQEKRSIGTEIANISAINKIAQTAKIIREERFALLDLNDQSAGEGDELPELVLKMLTDDEIKSMQNSAVGSDDDMDGLGAIPISDDILGDESLVPD